MLHHFEFTIHVYSHTMLSPIGGGLLQPKHRLPQQGRDPQSRSIPKMPTLTPTGASPTRTRASSTGPSRTGIERV